MASLQGLEDMRQSERDEFFSQFKADTDQQESFNKDHPAPVAAADPEPAKKKRKKVFSSCQSFCCLCVSKHVPFAAQSCFCTQLHFVTHDFLFS